MPFLLVPATLGVMSHSKKILLAISLLFQFTSYPQVSNQHYFFQEVGWNITLPMDFALLDLNNYSMNTGEDDEEDEMGMSMATQTMVVAIKDRFNYFSISITPFDEEDREEWKNSAQSFKEQVYRNMTRSMGRGQIDTTSSIEFIDGLAFDKFRIAMTTTKGLQLDMFLLCRLHEGYDFAITYLSLDEATKKEIELMLKNSSFK